MRCLLEQRDFAHGSSAETGASQTPRLGNALTTPQTWSPRMALGLVLQLAARVLIVNTDLLENPEDYPQSVEEPGDPKWKGLCGMARPLFGTTATHFAVLKDNIGQERTLEFLKTISNNAVVLSGNKQVATAVASGQLAWGLTDTDDAIIEKDHGEPITIIYRTNNLISQERSGFPTPSPSSKMHLIPSLQKRLRTI